MSSEWKAESGKWKVNSVDEWTSKRVDEEYSVLEACSSLQPEM